VREQVLGQEVVDLSVRRKRRLPDGRTRECDALAITPETVCLARVKSSLRSADIDHLPNDELPAFRTFFPEYQSLPLWSAWSPAWPWTTVSCATPSARG
jgi:hypothetical protein